MASGDTGTEVENTRAKSSSLSTILLSIFLPLIVSLQYISRLELFGKKNNVDAKKKKELDVGCKIS